MSREAHTFLRQSVEIRRGERLLPVATQIAVAQIVGKNVDDVGLGRGVGSDEYDQKDADQQAKH